MLCALRAANSGLDTLLATSEQASDDAIAELCRQNDIACFRGALDDVLSRYAAATADLPRQALVARLTADNMFPDGAFVQLLAEQLLDQVVDYLASGSSRPGLPYGMSAEIFRVSALREAADKASTAYEREHVTPWIIANKRHGRLHCTQSEDWGELSHLRCTMDSFSDYLRLRTIFDPGGEDALQIPWWQLVERLRGLPESPPHGVELRRDKAVALGRLQLGTAQLGMPYGIANRDGKPDDSQARELLELALRHGITHLDTARDYGDAETRLGDCIPAADAQRFTIVTKLSSLSNLPAGADPLLVETAVDASVFRSLRELRLQRPPVLLLHRWSHYREWNGAVWRHLLALQSEGVIGQLGVSVYTPEEALEASRESAIRHLQLPFNALDSRWLDDELQTALQKRPDLIVHGRSVFLQGLLTLPPDQWPQIPGVDTQLICQTLDQLMEQFQRQDRTDLCLAYARAQTWLDSLIIGVETPQQLSDNLHLFNQPALSPSECEQLRDELPDVPEQLVNPALWPPRNN